MHFFESLNFGSLGGLNLSLAVWLLILVALLFDFLNGFHDAANSVATVVSTRVLSPRTAILWAAFFNFVAFAFFPLNVSHTVSGTVTNADQTVIAATLLAACAWNLLTWYLALPTSSTHALIGALAGAAVTKAASFEVLNWAPVSKAMAFVFISPLLGLLFGLLFAIAVAWIFRSSTPRGVDRLFRQGQLLSAAWFSLNHGGNDAQKTMGIIALLVTQATGQEYGAGHPMPTELVLACYVAIGLGTMFGGWRIVKTMGQKIIALRPVDGFCAETGAGMAVALATAIGSPVSTTHTITGAILGVGAMKRFSAVRRGVAGRVV